MCLTHNLSIDNTLALRYNRCMAGRVPTGKKGEEKMENQDQIAEILKSTDPETVAKQLRGLGLDLTEGPFTDISVRLLGFHRRAVIRLKDGAWETGSVLVDHEEWDPCVVLAREVETRKSIVDQA